MQFLVSKLPLMLGALVLGLSYSWGTHFLMRFALRGKGIRRVFLAAIPIWALLGAMIFFDSFFKAHTLLFGAAAFVALMHGLLVEGPKLHKEFPNFLR